MKRLFIIVCGVAMLAGGVTQARGEDTLESELGARLKKAIDLSASEVKPNEIVSGGLTYSGVLVEVVKTDNPLQLVNPFAPEQYGSAWDNSLHDLKTNTASGWKLFSIDF